MGCAIAVSNPLFEHKMVQMHIVQCRQEGAANVSVLSFALPVQCSKDRSHHEVVPVAKTTRF